MRCSIQRSCPMKKVKSNSGLRRQEMKKLFVFLVVLLGLFVARAQSQYSTGQQLPMTHMSGLLNLAESIPLPGDGYMDHLTVDVNGQRLFISGEAAKSVITVDLRAGKVVHLTEGLPAMPKKPFYLADSNEVWLTLTDSSVVAVSGSTYTVPKILHLSAFGAP